MWRPAHILYCSDFIYRYPIVIAASFDRALKCPEWSRVTMPEAFERRTRAILQLVFEMDKRVVVLNYGLATAQTTLLKIYCVWLRVLSALWVNFDGTLFVQSAINSFSFCFSMFLFVIVNDFDTTKIELFHYMISRLLNLLENFLIILNADIAFLSENRSCIRSFTHKRQQVHEIHFIKWKLWHMSSTKHF